MDNFMDKLAKRFNAGEIIKANSQAEARDMKRMQERTAEYERMMQEMRRLNLKNVELTEQVQQLIQCGIEQLENYGSGEELLGNKIDETGISLRTEAAVIQGTLKENADSVNENVESIKSDVASVKEEIEPVKNYMYSIKYSVDSVKEQVDSIMDNTDSVKDHVDSMKENVDSVKDHVDSMKENVDSVKGNVDSMKENVDSVKGNVDSMKYNIDSVKDNVDIMKDDMNTIKDSVDFMKDNMDFLKSNVDSVKYNTDSVKDSVDSVKDTMEILKGSVSDAVYKTDDGFYRVSGRLDEMERAINEELQQNHQAVFVALRDLEDKAGNDDEMKESIRTMKELLVGFRLSSEEGQKHLEEHVHKENVRVYRNVQAALSEEATRKARELGERMDRLESDMKKNSGVKLLVIITLLLSLASFGMQVAQILQLF